MSGALILITCEYPPFPGGIGTYAGEMAKAVADAGTPVLVIGPGYDGMEADPPQAIRHELILRHHSIPPGAIWKIIRLLRAAPRGATILAADIRTILIVYLLKPFHRRSYRAMVHGSEASKFRAGSLPFKLARQAYLNAELVAYNSTATRDIFCTQIGVPAREVVSHLGVEPQWFVPVEREFEHPELANIAPDVPVFCSVGRLEPRKGQRETVQALAMARDRFGLVDPVYVIVGRAEDDAYAESIMEEARKLSLRTILTGPLSMADVKRVYKRSVAHLLFARALPGKIEGFGLVLLEAAAQGCISIAAAIGGIPEVVGDTGALVPADDVEAFAKRIAEEAADPAGLSIKGESARLWAHSFTWQNCAAKTFPELLGPDLPLSDRERP